MRLGNGFLKVLAAGILATMCAAGTVFAVGLNMPVYLNTTSQGANVSGTVTSVPIVIQLDSANFGNGFPACTSDGSNIRFFNKSGVELPREIASFDKTGQWGIVWVLVDTVLGNNGTQYITLVYDTDAPAYTKGPVFSTSSGYLAAWHFNSAAPTLDATGQYNLTDYHTTGTPLGVVGDARTWDTTDADGEDSMRVASLLGEPSAVTINLWAKIRMTDSGHTSHGHACDLISMGDNLGVRVTDSGFFCFFENGTTWQNSKFSGNYVNDTWYMFTYSIDPVTGNQTMYVNGTLVKTTTFTGPITYKWGQNTLLGKHGNGATRWDLDGQLDEVQVHQTVRSADYIKLCHANQQIGQTLVNIENYSDWMFNKNITFNTKPSGANVTASVTNFPVLLKLNRGNFPFYQAMDNGEDIRFSKSNGDHLYYTIEKWDRTKMEAVVWVLLDTVRGNDSTQSITMYWGRSGAPSRSNGSAVFDNANGYDAVWHFEDLTDATSGGWNLTNSGSTATRGVIGNGRNFVSDLSQKAYTASSFNPNDSGTIEAWICRTGYGSSPDRIMGGDDGFEWKWSGTSPDLYFDVFESPISGLNASTTLSQNVWYHVACTWNKATGTIKSYVNGVLTNTGSGYNDDPGSDVFSFGTRTGSSEYSDGSLDEVRISRKVRDLNYLKLCFQNQKDNQTFITIPSFSEDYTQWPYSQRVYFNTKSSGANIVKDVYNFPFLVRLTKDNFNFNQSVAGGKDLRFSDPDGSHLPYEIESWDQMNQKAVVWVKVPKVDGNSYDDYINIHYGSYSAPDMQWPDSLWDSDFAGVWHLKENPQGTIVDATPNGNNGTSSGGMTATDRVDAVVGKGLDFDGVDDYLDMGNTPSLNIGKTTNRITMSAWVKFAPGSLNNSFRPIIAMGDHSYHLQIRNISDKFEGVVYDGDWESAYSNEAPSEDAWYHLACYYDGSKVVLYVNGIRQSTTSDASSIVSTTYNLNIGRNSEQTSRIFKGVIDEVQISKEARDTNWIKLAYENQRPDSKLQTTPGLSIAPVFDGSLTNKPSDFENAQTTMNLIHAGENPSTDTMSHILMRFDLRQAAKLQGQGWTLENAMLNMNVDSLYTPLYRDSAYVGIYSGDRMLPVDKHDGYRAWREDLSTLDSVIKISGTNYARGISGQPDSSGDTAWVLYDFQSEIRRLGLASVDSIAWKMGSQPAGLSVYVKKSNSSTAPTDSVWEINGSGVTNIEDGHITGSAADSLRWLWVAAYRTPAGVDLSGVWGDFKVYGKRHKNAEVLLYQVKDDGINAASLSWSNRGTSLPWRHASFEQDAGTDSCEGIGTEDLAQVFPGHDPYWNRYKDKYRSRGPVASVNIAGSMIPHTGDSSAYYFGVENSGRLLPSDMANGYYSFKEDQRAGDSSIALKMNDTIYSGIGGSGNGTGNFAYLLFNLQSESSRLNFGKQLAIRGKAGYCDGSDSVEVYIKTCTTTVQPTLSNWTGNTGSVKQRIHHTSWSGSHYAAVNITTDSSGGPASKIKWVWLAVYSTKGTGSTSFGAFADLRIMTEPKVNYSLVIQSNMIAQAVQKAVSDTTQPYVTLLGVCKDAGSAISFATSRATIETMQPQLSLNFSDSRTLLSWEGRDSNLVYPADKKMAFSGVPVLGDGRFDRVVRFPDNSNHYAQISDSNHIDYSQGSISFYYEKDKGTGSGTGMGATFFKRDVSNNTQFKLCRDGSLPKLTFCFGDTSDTNKMIWAYVDSFVSAIDTLTHDTAWQKDTIVNPFDGGQHFFYFTWNSITGSASLVIDGKFLVAEKTLTFSSNPASWAKDSLKFGRYIDGYIENLVIRSKTTVPTGIAVAQASIDSVRAYLPYIQPAFNDTVECIVVSPDDKNFQDVCNTYAMRNISMGVRTVVITLAEISKYYPGADIQEKIRNMLKQAYLTWHSKYVVLAGSTGLIPSRQVAFKSADNQEVTTDRYFGCLEGNWNENGNEYFAEVDDNTDMTSELIIGRLRANTWDELRSMVERSTMALGLPPYQEQCLGNNDTVAISGIQMFNDVGSVSDGQYYGNQLKDILKNGAYTSAMPVKTYYPNDDPANDTTQSVEERRTIFLNFLKPLPGMWVHFGHGNFSEFMIDKITETRDVRLTATTLDNDIMFNKFKRMTHVRLVGCNANSISQRSFGDAFDRRRYGGTMSYLGASDVSYPVVESQLLQEEFRTIADSSVFVWGDVFARSANSVLASNGTWDISRWVAFTRNYLGDPLLPVRYRKISADSVLQFDSILSNVIKIGENNLTVQVTAQGKPVEGVSVGLVDDNISNAISDSIKDFAFARGTTNRRGEASLKFNVAEASSLTLTAAHNDYLATRQKIGGDYYDTSGFVLCWKVIRDSNSVDSMNNNGVNEASDTISVAQFGYLPNTVDINSVSVMMSFDTSGTGIVVSNSAVNIGEGKYDSIKAHFALNQCPPGARNLKVKIFLYANGVPYDTVPVTIPVVGVKIMPIITYLLKQQDTIAIPSAGDSIKMKILMGNNYSARAQGVKCEVIDYNPSFCTIEPEVTGTHSISPWGSAEDDSIHIYIKPDYNMLTSGIITAKLRITGTNIKPDTIPIDLNPIKGLTIRISSKGPELDYTPGVFIQWEPLKFSGNNKNSDFLGYVVLRSTDTSSSEDEDVLTTSPISSACYFYDKLPDTGSNQFFYRIIAVDSSYNFCADTIIKVLRPLFVKKGFPIFTGQNMMPPVIANADKDTIGEIYSASSLGKGVITGYRASGQEAVVDRGNDGVVASSAYKSVTTDLNGDGLDDIVYATDDSLIAFNPHAEPGLQHLWSAIVKNTPHNNSPDVPLQWYWPLIAADVNGDGLPEIIAMSTDNIGGASATTIDLYSNNTGMRLARKIFSDASYAPAIAVGDFVKGDGDSLEILVVAHSKDADKTYWLYLLDSYKTSDTSFHTSDSIQVSDFSGANGSIKRLVNSGLSVGKLYNDPAKPNALQVVLKTCLAGIDKNDTAFVYTLDTAGKFVRDSVAAVCARHQVTLGSDFFMWGSNGALGDLDNDNLSEIVYAGDDTVYVLKMVDRDSLSLIQAIPYGRRPSSMIGGTNGRSAQALIVKLDTNPWPEIIVNHQGDGAIWAFKKDSDTGKYSLKEGFPFKAAGRVIEACNVTDLEGDDTLDLVAADGAGYLFAWKLGKGSAANQPWPSAFGNNWNTGNTDYKEAGVVGYLYEDWKAKRKAPFAWIESDTSNATDTVFSGNVFDTSNGVLQTSQASDRNIHFNGPGVKNWRNYTIKGKMKFDSANAEFGVNFCSKWPDTARKYTLRRCSDGYMRLYYSKNGSSDSLFVGSYEDGMMNSVNLWYNYEIIVVNDTDKTRVSVTVWPDSIPKPKVASLDASDTSTNRLTSGLVGFSTHSGTGNRYWSPVKVFTNNPATGANMAFEDFKADSIVDIKPYTPVNWYPDYGAKTLTVGNDTTGFVLDKSGASPVLVYRHKPGVTYPVTCKLAPYTNLEWRDYEFSGKIVKPDSAVYDSIWVGVDVYSNNGNQYRFKFRNDTMLVSGGGINPTVALLGHQFDHGDTLNFKISATTDDKTVGTLTYKDSVIHFIAKVGINNSDIETKFDNTTSGDESSSHIKTGTPSIFIDLNNKEGTATDAIRIKDVKVQKISL